MKRFRAILPLRTRTHFLALAIGALTWLCAIVASYLVAPMAAGRGLLGAYAAFGSGPNLGNVLVCGAFTLWGAVVLLVIRGSRLSATTSMLAAHGLIAIGAFYPATVMSLGLARVLGDDGELPGQGLLAMDLVFTGGLALVMLVGTWSGRWIFSRAVRLGRIEGTPARP